MPTSEEGLTIGRWSFPCPAVAPAGQELLAVGADLEPVTMLGAYRNGLFPMPVDGGADSPIGWWSPDPRGVLKPCDVHLGRSLRRRMRGFEFSVDQVFDEVVNACADPRRARGWIDSRMIAAYSRLHEAGLAHSIEVREHGRPELAGGLFGVEVGGLFAAESMFHRVPDASKAAVVWLARRLSDDRRPAVRLIDVQWHTPHLASMGAMTMPREDYLASLADAVESAPVFQRSA